jgi:hypothetical protein
MAFPEGLFSSLLCLLHVESLSLPICPGWPQHHVNCDERPRQGSRLRESLQCLWLVVAFSALETFPNLSGGGCDLLSGSECAIRTGLKVDLSILGNYKTTYSGHCDVSNILVRANLHLNREESSEL